MPILRTLGAAGLIPATLASAFILSAQSAVAGKEGTDGQPEIRTFPLPSPDADRAAIDAHKKVLRAEIMVDSSTRIRFYEEPTNETTYNSSVTVERQGLSPQTYRVGKMIRHQPLRLVHIALIRSDKAGMLVCEYEGGAVGAREGFAILRFSSAGVELHTLPLTDFGKVVVSRGDPEWAEIWSGLPDDVGPSAKERRYSTRACRWQKKSYFCGPPKPKPGLFVPGAINDPGIEVLP